MQRIIGRKPTCACFQLIPIWTRKATGTGNQSDGRSVLCFMKLFRFPQILPTTSCARTAIQPWILWTVVLVAVQPLFAQKGTGDAFGVVGTGLADTVYRVSGNLVQLATHPCEQTTGPAPLGTHLHLRTTTGATLNVHLGPADEVAYLEELLVPGQHLEIDVFRTAALPEDQCVAQVIYTGNQVVALRDDSLRPQWAGQRNGYWGNNPPQAWSRRRSWKR